MKTSSVRGMCTCTCAHIVCVCVCACVCDGLCAFVAVQCMFICVLFPTVVIVPFSTCARRYRRTWWTRTNWSKDLEPLTGDEALFRSSLITCIYMTLHALCQLWHNFSLCFCIMKCKDIQVIAWYNTYM